MQNYYIAFFFLYYFSGVQYLLKLFKKEYKLPNICFVVQILLEFVELVTTYHNLITVHMS